MQSLLPPIPSGTVDMFWDGTTTATDRLNWLDFQRCFYGRHRDMMDAVFAKLYPDDYAAGTLEQVYGRILRAFLDELSPSLMGDVRVEGTPEIQALCLGDGDPAEAEAHQGWIDVLNAAWQIRRGAGASWVHFALRGDRPELDLVLGHQWEGVIDPLRPGSLQACSMIRLAISGGFYAYYRDKSGLVRGMRYSYKSGTSETVDIGYQSTMYPVFPFVRDPTDRCKPQCDETLLALQRTFNCQLTDLEHHRLYMPGQPTLYSDERDNNEGAKHSVGPNKTQLLGTSERYEYVQPGGNLTEQIQVMREWVALNARLYGLSPETFQVQSYAETGPAKAGDQAVNYALRCADRRQCVRAVAGFVRFASMLLESIPGWQGKTAGWQIIPAVVQEPGRSDPFGLHATQAISARAALGIETVEEWVARERNIPLSEAERIVAANQAKWKRANVAGTGTPNQP